MQGSNFGGRSAMSEMTRLFIKAHFATGPRPSGKTYSQYTQFEAILVRTDEGWQILVQKQYRAMTEEQWNELVDGENED